MGGTRCGLPSSALPVTVSVHQGAREVTRLTTLLGEPEVEVVSLAISPDGVSPDPVPLDGTADFKVEAEDAGGNRVEGLSYSWYLEPAYDLGGSPGNGRLIPIGPRDRHQIRVEHRYLGEDGNWDNIPGWVRLRVRARNNGVEVWGNYELELAP